MRLADVDLRPLLGPGLLAAGAALLLAGAVIVGGQWVQQAEREFRDARRELSGAAREYRDASDDQAVYQRYASRFSGFGERGWIGEEQRLSWIEALQAINADLRLPTLRYEIDQQSAATIAGMRMPARLDLRRSRMRLRVGALHEGDILKLLERLRDEGNGFMVISQCSLQRNGSGPEVRVDPRQANVDTRCAVDWYTLRMQREDG